MRLNGRLITIIKNFVCPCINGASLHSRIVSLVPISRPHTTSPHSAHTQENPKNVQSIGWGRNTNVAQLPRSQH